MRRVIGDELKRLRIARGLSLRATAARAGVTPAMLSEIENGKRDARFTTIERVADALGARCMLAAKNE